MGPPEWAAWLRLSVTPGIGNSSARKLLAALGLPQAIFQAHPQVLHQLVSARQVEALTALPRDFAVLLARTEDWLAGTRAPGLEGLQRQLVTLGDADYPAALLQMEDPPLLLYVQGCCPLKALDTRRCLAMVGSRNPTLQGAANARQFASSLAAAGLTVVSGLALGVDGAAHEGALQASDDVQAGPSGAIRTVAIVGTGLDRVYPRQHHDLARRIAAHGLLISEYPLGTPPLAPNFPRRNRLIAGLSHATLVVEAALQSGSLIKARLASEQGKDVLAIPGSINSPSSRGCHALIKQGAKLVESAADVLEEFDGEFALKNRANMSEKLGIKSTSPDEDGLLQALGGGPVSLDALQARTGWPAAHLQAQLLSLELDGEVVRLPGGLFQRLGTG